MKLCKRCVLPLNFPHVVFDDEGVCSTCREFAGKKKISMLKAEYKKKFEKLIRKVRGKGDYDLLMCYSGGKDSTYALNLLKRKYKLNILAYTFDNGFVPERTYINIRNVVEKLGVDHIIFKPDFSILKAIFSSTLKRNPYSLKTLERASPVCTSCMGMVKYSAIRTAIEKEIPLIAFGWSPGQAPVTSSVLEINPAMMRTMEKAIQGPLTGIAGKGLERFFPSEKHYKTKGRFPVFVHPLELFPYNEKNILKFIKNLGWIMPSGIDLNASNCLLNSLADEAHIAQYKFHPYAGEIAALVREGYMTRAEGLAHLPVKKSAMVLKAVRKKLGLSGGTR
jgi:tRNA(Ile)-lysidine synthase TilS/MesJ